MDAKDQAECDKDMMEKLGKIQRNQEEILRLTKKIEDEKNGDRIKMKTISNVRDIVESEGLGYAIESYMSGDDIEDEDLKAFWSITRDAMKSIRRILDTTVEES